MSTEARLEKLGDQLERVFAADLEAEARGSWFSTRRGRWLGGATAILIAVPGVAYAAGVFTSPQTVAKSLPAGARIFGSTPTCKVVRPNLEYHCTLAKAPPPDPITHLTPKQWYRYLATPPNLGKVKLVTRRYEVAPGKWTTGQFAVDLPRLERITNAYRAKVLASFGFTPTQIRDHMAAIANDTAGIPAGGFKGTVEPTVDATHHINGGCRATSPDGSQWECYIGQAAVREKLISPPSKNPNSGGLGTYISGPGVG